MTALDTEAATAADHARAAARGWLSAFESALAARSEQELKDLFEEAAGWRDLFAFTWNMRQAHNSTAIADLLLAVCEEIEPTGFMVDENRPGPTVISAEGDPVTVEVFFRFSTKAGGGDGYTVLSLGPDGKAAQAHTLLTRLVSLNDVQPVWPPVGRFDNQNPTTRWLEHRQERTDYTDRSPEVLIVGAGQFGLMTGAHLGRLGVDTLIVDKQEAVGDAWRTRYESLFLHQPNNILHFSMMPFPESFPEYLPKDKMAEWLETYAASFDLNIWTGTEFLNATYDEAAGHWNVVVRRDDGTLRELSPKHVLMATGGSDIPNIPDIEGIDEFQGEKVHAAQFRDGRDFTGKDVLVVGCGTSGHDFALDIVRSGGHATLVQRGPLVVIDLPTANTLYGDYNNRDVPTELVDIRFMSGFVYHQLREGFLAFQQGANEADSELHSRLAKAGVEIWGGPDECGFYYTYLSKSKGGFYINVGASDAIVDGDIKVVNHDSLERFDADGVVFNDSTHQHFDAVIFATAYRPIVEGVKKLFGEKVTRKLGPVWGFGNDGELNNILKPTAQQGLWIMEGSIPMARWHSPLMALIVKAELDGLVPESFKAEGHPSRTPSEPVPALAPVFGPRQEA